MAAAAHNPAVAARMGIPQAVARDFNRADTGSAMLHKGMAAMMARKGVRKR